MRSGPTSATTSCNLFSLAVFSFTIHQTAIHLSTTSPKIPQRALMPDPEWPVAPLTLGLYDLKDLSKLMEKDAVEEKCPLFLRLPTESYVPVNTIKTEQYVCK